MYRSRFRAWGLRGNSVILMKPFLIDDLLATVAAVLERTETVARE